MRQILRKVQPLDVTPGWNPVSMFALALVVFAALVLLTSTLRPTPVRAQPPATTGTAILSYGTLTSGGSVVLNTSAYHDVRVSVIGLNGGGPVDATATVDAYESLISETGGVIGSPRPIEIANLAQAGPAGASTLVTVPGRQIKITVTAINKVTGIPGEALLLVEGRP